MNVLGIESSCDETAAAVVTSGRELRSSVVASQIAEHADFGGVVPEIASRRHLENIGWVVEKALTDSGLDLSAIDGLAVTRGPGLAGSLLVGLCYAKAVALVRKLPLVGVNHIEAHIAALPLEHGELAYPALALVVSGGHSALYLQRTARRFKVIGRTRDDAVGEAFDKVARLLGLGYPGGPVIDRLARGFAGEAVSFPRSRMRDGSLDFSFSGLKSAVARHVRDAAIEPGEAGCAPSDDVCAVAAGFQQAAVAMLVGNLRRATEDWRPRTLVLAGGVACNSLLRAEVETLGRALGVGVVLPTPSLATDNAAMIAALGYHLLVDGVRHGDDLDIDPDLAPGE